MAMARHAVLDAAIKDAAFRQLCERAVQAVLTGQDEDVQVTAFVRVLRELPRFVEPQDVEQAQDILAQYVSTAVARARGVNDENELVGQVRAAMGVIAQLPRNQPRRYPIAPGNPASIDQRGTLRNPLGMTNAQRDEVRQFEDDVLAERPRRGHPTGLLMPAEEFKTRYLEVLADLKSAERETSQQNIATHMPMSIWQLRRHVKRYGRPTE
jgi:hypothetical protein